MIQQCRPVRLFSRWYYPDSAAASQDKAITSANEAQRSLTHSAALPNHQHSKSWIHLKHLNTWTGLTLSAPPRELVHVTMNRWCHVTLLKSWFQLQPDTCNIYREIWTQNQFSWLCILLQIRLPTSLNLQCHVQKCQVTAMFAELQEEIAQIKPILKVCNYKFYLIC